MEPDEQGFCADAEAGMHGTEHLSPKPTPPNCPDWLYGLVSLGVSEKDLAEINHQTAQIKIVCDGTTLPEFPVAWLAPNALQVIADKLGHGGHCCATITQEHKIPVNFAFMLDAVEAPPTAEENDERTEMAKMIVALQTQNAELIKRLDAQPVKGAAGIGEDATLEKIKNVLLEKMLGEAIKDPNQRLQETMAVFRQGVNLNNEMREIAELAAPAVMDPELLEDDAWDKATNLLTDPNFASNPLVRGACKKLGIDIDIDSDYAQIENEATSAEAG